MLDHALSACVDRAIARLPHTCRHAPVAGQALVEWAAGLSRTGKARDYFDGGRAILFLFPWWLEKRIVSTPDIRFQEVLVESTVNAYYFIRLIDNQLDEGDPDERRLLPLLGLLHTNFCRAYARLFAADDPFWEHFECHWNATIEAAIREKQLPQLSATDFAEVAARKTSGVKIPLAAVCCRYRRLDLLEPWCGFYDRFAAWLQMLDDIFDWMRDQRSGNVTFFLSEGERRKGPGESVAGWVVRRGFAWGSEWLAAAMRDLRRDAERLDSPELARFLEYRETELRELTAHLQELLRDVAKLANVFEPVDGESTRA